MTPKWLIPFALAILCLLLVACGNVPAAVSTEQTLPSTIESTAVPINEPKMTLDIGFSGYQDYLSFFQGDLEEYFVSDTMTAYLQAVQENSQILRIPCHNGTPVTLRDKEGFDGIVIMEQELYYFLWTWFFTDIDGGSLTVHISKLSEEYAARADSLTCSELIAVIAPDAPNVHNYQEKEDYSSIYEAVWNIGGTDRSVLIANTVSGKSYVSFTMDGHLVMISTSTHTDTASWLADFTLAAP